MRKYTTIQGDTWDIIAYKVYGDSKYMNILAEANMDYIRIYRFPANITLNIPEIEAEATSIVPPWKR